MMSISDIEKCCLDLHSIGVVKFGDFKLKSGMQSPVYFDLRVIVAHPKLLEKVSKLMWSIRPEGATYSQICGVAYTGLPIATLISVNQNIPMLIRRKESKDHGTKKLVEGIFDPGDNCLIIEDVIVSGSSVLETIQTLKGLDLLVTDAVVFLDRQQGGVSNLRNIGINVISVVTITQLMNIFLKHDRIDQATVVSVLEFVNSHTTQELLKNEHFKGTDVINKDRDKMTYEARMSLSNNSLAKRIFNVMITKETNLCLAADVTSSEELISLADKVGPYICLLKTHVDILRDFTQDTINQLKKIAVMHNFLLFEDRKFGDIGRTVINQYSGGLYNIVDWADLITVHGLPGHGIIKGLASCLNNHSRGCVLVAEMSSEGALTSPEYVKGCNQIAEANVDFVVGLVSQSRVNQEPRLILMTPGVQIEGSSDGLGQQYVSPHTAVLERGADVIIVGRGITKAVDPAASAKVYQKQAFDAYRTRVGV